MRALVGRVDGSWRITDTYAYDSWGNLIGRRGSTVQPFTWNGSYGYEYNFATGLYHVGAREYDPRTGRWLQRDPIDAASGDPNLYRYAGNDPVNRADPTGLDWLDNTANFFAGVGDSLTFGITDQIREWLGVNDVVDKASLAYRVGEYTEVGAEIALTGGAKALTHLAYKKGYKEIRRESMRFIRKFRLPGKEVHHSNPLLGHPGGEGTLFPLGGLPPSIHSGRWNLEVLDHATHLRRHRRMKQQEKLLRWNTNRYTITLRTLNNLRRDITSECPN